MIDVLSDGLRAAATRSAAAYPLIALAGAATSVGPCVAPRALAVAALAHRAARPAPVIAAFIAGVLGAYAAVAAGAGAVASLLGASHAAYALLAAALAVAGTITLARANGTQCDARAHHASRRSGLGGVALLGASSALVVSPCCAPAVAAIAGLTAASGRADGVALAAAFAFGHALPLVAAGMAGARVASGLRTIAAHQAPAIVSGTLMLALAAFYGAVA